MKCILKLYIANETIISRRAIANLRKIVEFFEGQYGMEIIDILEDPESAVDDHIIAIPAMVKSLPPPPSMFIGDLSDTESLLISLRLNSKIKSEQQE